MKSFVLLTTLTGLASLALAANTQAADWDQNLYFGVDTGAVFQQDADFAQAGAPTYNATFKTGVRGDFKVGYNLCESAAVELESGVQWDSIDTLSGFSLSANDEPIDLYSVPIMANFVYKLVNQSAWTPYVGVGIGANVGVFDGRIGPSTYRDTSVTFAYQAEAGVKYALAKNASLGVAYKFMGTADQKYNIDFGGGAIDHITIGGVYIHGIFANFTWSF